MLSSGALTAGQTSGRLRYLPGSVYPQQLEGAVLEAVSHAYADGIVVATLHSYDFAGFGEPLPEFRKNFARMNFEALVDDLQLLKAVPGVRIVSLADLEQSGDDLSAQRLQANSSLLGGFVTRHRLLPAFLGLYPSQGVYYTQDAARSIQTRQLLACILLYVSLFGAIGFAAMRLLRWSGRIAPNVAGALLVISISGAVLLVPKFVLGTFYMSSALALTCCAGLFVAAVFHRQSAKGAASRASRGSARLDAALPADLSALPTAPGGL